MPALVEQWLSRLGGLRPSWFDANAPQQSATPAPASPPPEPTIGPLPVWAVPATMLPQEGPEERLKVTPAMRAATPRERVGDWLTTLAEAVSQQPVVQAGAKALGQGAEVFNEAWYGNLRPETGASVAGMPDLPGAATWLPKGFYSRLDRAIEAIPTNKPVHPNAIRNAIKGQVSAEEVQWRGLEDFLAGKTQVTKGEVQAWLKEHPLALEEAQKGSAVRVSPRDVDKPLTTLEARQAYQEGQRVHWYQRSNGNRVEMDDLASMGPRSGYTRDVLAGEAEWRTGGVSNVGDVEAGTSTQAITPPKFAQWQVPGGEAYRESLTTLGKPELTAADRAKRQAVFAKYEDEINALHRQGVDMTLTPHERLVARTKRDALEGKRESEAQAAAPLAVRESFRASHWQEPDVLLHRRLNERTLPTGERGLFVEEIQSDWHQKGKAKGYQLANDPRMGQLKATQKDGYFEVSTVDGQFVTNVYWGDAATAEEAITQAQRRVRLEPNRTSIDERVPDAPFKESWPDLALKQTLREAAERPDVEWVGWTVGETQAARYDLKKYVDELLYDPDKHYLVAMKNGYSVIERQGVTADQLPGIVGKEMSERLLSAPRMDWGPHALRGEKQLEVGGEGMHEFYDKLLVKRAEKLVKPFGGTVERQTVRAGTKFKDAWVPGQPEVGTHEPQQTSAWIIRLTPAMKEAIRSKGFPLLTLAGVMAAPKLAVSHERTR